MNHPSLTKGCFFPNQHSLSSAVDLEKLIHRMTHADAAFFEVALEVQQKMEQGATPPNLASTPTPCSHCKGWSVHLIVAIDWAASLKTITLQCPCCQTQTPLTMASHDKIHVIQAKIQPQGAEGRLGKKLPYWKDLANLRFQKPPKGYVSPWAFYRSGILTIAPARKVPLTNRDALKISSMLEAQRMPIHYFMDPEMGRGIERTCIPPDLRLESLKWFQPYANFIFKDPASLTDGLGVPFLAYAVVPAGAHRAMGHDYALMHTKPHLYVWTTSSDATTTTLLTIPLFGTLSDLHFAQTWDSSRVSFYRNLLKRVVTIALVAATEPDVVETIHYREKRVKPKKHHGTGNRERLFRTYEHAWLTWPEINPDARDRIRKEKSHWKMPPHVKAGHFQRYHTKKGTVLRWKAPQRCNFF